MDDWRPKRPPRLNIKPLTRAEQKWVDELQAVLARCPKRLQLVTIGDASLEVIDGVAGHGLDLHDGLADAQGLVLAHIPGGPIVHGVSG